MWMNSTRLLSAANSNNHIMVQFMRHAEPYGLLMFASHSHLDQKQFRRCVQTLVTF